MSMRDLIGAPVQADEVYESRNGTRPGRPTTGVIESLEVGFGQYPEEDPPLWVAIRDAAGDIWYAFAEDVRLL